MNNLPYTPIAYYRDTRNLSQGMILAKDRTEEENTVVYFVLGGVVLSAIGIGYWLSTSK